MGKMDNKKIITFPVILLVLSLFVLAEDIPPGGPSFGSSGEDAPPQTPITTYDNTLKIIEITAEVDGKKDTITNNGEKISKQAKQESDVKFKIDIKNVWDKQIHDIGVDIIIENIDDGDDLDKDDSIESLGPGDSKTATLNFNLPLKVDDGEYNVGITIEGRDENNNRHILNWGLRLEVKKDQHNVMITKASLYPSVVQCGGAASLDLGILNIGRDEEDIELDITNEELKINIKEKDIALDTGADDDAEYEKNFRLDIPPNIASGTYPISINARYNNGRSLASKKVNLVIYECIQTKQRGVSIKGLSPAASETLNLQAKPAANTVISAQSDASIILFLSIILIIILALVIFLLGVIIAQLRR